MKGYQSQAHYHPLLETIDEVVNDWAVTKGKIPQANVWVDPELWDDSETWND